MIKVKVKIGGQKYNLEDLSEPLRNKIQHELNKEDMIIQNDHVDNEKKSNIKKETSDDKKENVSLFRKMFGYH